MSEIVTVTGTIEDIIYTNEENGYTVCDLMGPDSEYFTAVGFLPCAAQGQMLSLSGEWIRHPDYGKQFKIEAFEMIEPDEEDDILAYLASGIVEGVREATAKKLVEHFGKDTLNIMLTDPSRLAEIKGISPKKAKKIGESYKETRAVQSIVIFLQQYNLSVNLAMRIHSFLGANAVDAIKQNPYVLADRISGISFTTSDAIAYSMGVAKNSPLRIRSGILYFMQEAQLTSGHTYMPKALIIEHTAYNLGVEESEAESALLELIADNELIFDNIDNKDVIYTKPMYTAEAYVARRLATMSVQTGKKSMTPAQAEAVIDEVEEGMKISLAPEQRSAVLGAVSHGCLVITGGPGTGKTTTINTIIELMERMKLSVKLAAPTGRAAKRMSQLTGLEAQTIHRLLGVQSQKGVQSFIHDETNPLKADVIILDEVSMIDISLMASFLYAVKPGAKLILSGDGDQLPSIGAGNVLRDIIDSGAVPVVRLNHIFRQAQQSLIVMNAHRINGGEMPDLSVKDADFFYIRKDDAPSALKTVVELYTARLPKTYGVDPLSQIQVLSPTKKGDIGTVNLNRTLQDSINPPDAAKCEHIYSGTVFREGDKVMQIKNNYDIVYTCADGCEGTGVFNGDMGIIRTINTHDRSMTVIFDEDKTVEYPFESLSELDLAYAVTVHKSQGSEFPIVIMPVGRFLGMLMTRNLFYTAVTRAKKMVVLVGSSHTIGCMVKNTATNARYTGLRERLCNIKEIIDTKTGNLLQNH
ncbi:MAG: ATP-dependent RecD-like DNA helicase [Clostridiales bacterium]|nr:ATP-dependent RecD-like DNA helicase [Clostridiales bacterium]